MWTISYSLILLNYGTITKLGQGWGSFCESVSSTFQRWQFSRFYILVKVILGLVKTHIEASKYESSYVWVCLRRSYRPTGDKWVRTFVSPCLRPKTRAGKRYSAPSNVFEENRAIRQKTTRLQCERPRATATEGLVSCFYWIMRQTGRKKYISKLAIGKRSCI